MTLSDLHKMTDAELISTASDIIYSAELWKTGFELSYELPTKLNEEFLQLRSVIDELYQRHIIQPTISVVRPVVTNP